MSKKIFILLISSLIISGFFVVNNIYATINTAEITFSHECRGCGSGTERAILIPDYMNFQTWQLRVRGHVEGHGAAGPSGGKYGVDMCLSDNGAMWRGPCWNVVDANTGGNIGDGSADFDHTRPCCGQPDVGDSGDYRYGVVSIYTNDATANPVIFTTWGRQVSINGPSASINPINVGGQTDITWSTNEVSELGGVRIDYSGPVTCDLGASPIIRNGNVGDGMTCTATGAGTASFTVSATGYGGFGSSRPKTISSGPINVTINNPGGNVTFNVTDGCSGGNIGGNATINLTGIGSQVTTNAGAYNTTTFGSVPNGSRNWSSTVTGYNVVSGTVNVSGNTTVGVVQTRACGGPTGDMTVSNVPFGYTNSNGPIIIGYGNNATTLTWVSNATACSVTSSPNVGTWSGVNGTNVAVGALTANTTFTMSCNNGITDTVVVNIPPTPTGLSASCPAPGTLATVNWNTSGGYNTFYYRALNGIVGDTGAYIPNSNENQLGTTGTVVTTAGSTYSVYVYAKNPGNGAWSNWAGTNFTCLAAPQPPTVVSRTISSPVVVVDNATQYTITNVDSDPAGGGNIMQSYALINLQGENAGSFRGFLTWGSVDWWPGEKNHIACTGGGWAVIQSTGGNSVYGHQNLDLYSCTTSVSGNNRTTTFVVTFNPATYTTPIIDNDISGYAANLNSLTAGWINFDTNFNLNFRPSISNVVINTPPVSANNTTTYDIVVSGSELSGGTNITHEYALINYDVNTNGADGHTPADHRGFLTWYVDGAYTGWDTYKDKKACAGGGIGAIQPGYGETYLRLDSCSTSVSGDSRTTTFRVRFDPSYVSPASNNDISGYICATWPNCVGWTRFDTNFSLAAASSVPVLGPPTATAITTTGATLGGNITSAGSPATITARGTCWGTTPAPVTNCSAEGGTASGVFSHVRSGMTANTLYYYRAYATNPTGTGYSVDGTFTSSAAADLTAGAVSPTTATAGTGLTFSATITNGGGTGTGSSFNNHFQVATAGGGGGTVSTLSVNTLAALASGASGVVTSSSYTFPSSGTYSVRACADQDASFAGTVPESLEGNNCGAWTDITVAPGAGSLPVLGSPTDTSITTSGATLGATLISAGSPATITARGTCWGTTPAPVTNCLAEGGTAIGVFSHVRSGMAAGTLYYYRGYATNGTGTGYSSDGTFTTSANPLPGVCGSRAGGPATDTRTYPTAASDWDVGDTYCSVGSPLSSPAFPAPGSNAVWQCQGTNGGSNATCTAVHDDSVDVTVTVNTALGGTVSSIPPGINNCSGTCIGSFALNTTVVLIPTPKSAYWKFTGWGITGGGPAGDCSGTGNCVLIIDGAKNATATFSPRSFRYIEF